MQRTATLTLLLCWTVPFAALADPPAPTIEPLVRVVDLSIGESQEVTLADGTTATVKVLELKETRDPIRDAVREARVRVEVNGQAAWIASANYHLPVELGGVQVDCPITGGYRTNCRPDAWALEKDARLRLWPAGSPWVRPGTLGYPVRQRWFASSTQMANEPCYVNACEKRDVRQIYYHYGLDFGGAEGLVEVVAATDGLVVSAREERLEGHEGTPVSPRYDVVYIFDKRGWYYRYSHFFSIDESIRPGVRVRRGQRLGLLGKEGGSGGWSHLHFDVHALQPSGRWGIQEAYAFVWQAYQREHRPELVAVARPHRVALVGEKVTLDASRSWSACGEIARFEWTFADGSTAEGETVQRTYDEPGYYSEVLRVTDAAGRVDCDFAIVHVQSPEAEAPFPPTIHVVYYPTEGIRPGDEVTFKVRTFGTTDGEETWDFGDGTPPVQTRSDGNVQSHAKDGYAVTTHRYAAPGNYVVRAGRTDRHGHRAVGHVLVRVADAP